MNDGKRRMRNRRLRIGWALRVRFWFVGWALRVRYWFAMRSKGGSTISRLAGLKSSEAGPGSRMLYYSQNKKMTSHVKDGDKARPIYIARLQVLRNGDKVVVS